MAGYGRKNTISRREISEMIGGLYTELMTLCKSEHVSPNITEGMLYFEKKLSDDTLADKIEIITSEICSAGLLIPDPAGGISNLRFAHKQFFEYLICKGFCLKYHHNKSTLSHLISLSANHKNGLRILTNEPNSINYLAECLGFNIAVILNPWNRCSMLILLNVIMLNKLNKPFAEHLRKIASSELRADSFKSLSTTDLYSVMRFFILGSSVVAISIIAAIFINFNAIAAALGFMSGASYVFASSPATTGGNRALIVLIKCLRFHWSKAGIKIDDPLKISRLAVRSIKYSKVQFPDGQRPHDTSNIKDHLNPALDFGCGPRRR